MEELIIQLKKDIIEALSLEDVVPDDFDADTPLFVEGLGLDSIDALEIGVMLSRQFGIKITSNDKRNNQIFSSLRSLAEFIADNRSE